MYQCLQSSKLSNIVACSVASRPCSLSLAVVKLEIINVQDLVYSFKLKLAV